MARTIIGATKTMTVHAIGAIPRLLAKQPPKKSPTAKVSPKPTVDLGFVR